MNSRGIKTRQSQALWPRTDSFSGYWPGATKEGSGELPTQERQAPHRKTAREAQ